jgi:hypothetical protein
VSLTRDDLKIGAAGKKKRFLITSAMAGSPADEKILSTLKHYCRKTGTTPIVLGCRAHTKALRDQPKTFDKKIKKHLGSCIYSEYVFNRNLHAQDVQINPQQINPTTGMHRFKFLDKIASTIVASPKMHLVTLPVGNGGLPRVLFSTGTISKPDYQKNRIGKLATQMHHKGGWIVEILTDDLFLFRPIEFMGDGSFVDLGVIFRSDGTSDRVRTLSMVFGDLHAEKMRKKSFKICMEQLNFFKPEASFWHDILSASSITHHNHGKAITQFLSHQNFPSLECEIREALKWIQPLFDASMNNFIVHSNHHDHILQWIESERWRNDLPNKEIAHKLSLIAMKGQNLLQAMIDPSHEYVWLGANDDVYVAGIHHSSHGHLGGNGKRGSNWEYANIQGKSYTAHTHSASMFEGVWTVGTNSEFDLLYNKGPSGWIQANGITYETGTRQMFFGIPQTDIWNNGFYD